MYNVVCIEWCIERALTTSFIMKVNKRHGTPLVDVGVIPFRPQPAIQPARDMQYCIRVIPCFKHFRPIRTSTSSLLYLVLPGGEQEPEVSSV